MSFTEFGIKSLKLLLILLLLLCTYDLTLRYSTGSDHNGPEMDEKPNYKLFLELINENAKLTDGELKYIFDDFDDRLQI